MERIHLTKQEKVVLRHAQNSEKPPRDISPTMYEYCLSTLQEKGLVRFKADYGEIVSVKITTKGRTYMEQNPRLKNPVDWKWIITTVIVSITAIATTFALFVACTRLM